MNKTNKEVVFQGKMIEIIHETVFSNEMKEDRSISVFLKYLHQKGK